jgi:hypothetical protein
MVFLRTSAQVSFIFLMGWVWVHLVLRPLFGLLYQPRMIDDECGLVDGMRIGRGNISAWRKFAPVPLCPLQIPQNLTRARTRAAAMGSRRLTAWAMARPRCQITSLDYVTTISLHIISTYFPLLSNHSVLRSVFYWHNNWTTEKQKSSLELHLSHPGRNVDSGCFRLGCWGECFGIRERIYQEGGEDRTMRSYIIHSVVRHWLDQDEICDTNNTNGGTVVYQQNVCRKVWRKETTW